MAKAATGSVRDYVAAMPPDVRARVERLRALVKAVAPAAIEHRSYGIIGYKVDGRPYLYCGGFRSHVAMYPITAAMRRDHAQTIAPYQASKGTLKFPLDERLPVALITRLLKTRLAEMRPPRTAAGRRTATAAPSSGPRRAARSDRPRSTTRRA